MPAQIQSVFLCPRCEEGITSIAKTTECPSCGLPLGKQLSDTYTPPYTLTEQHEKLGAKEDYVRFLTDLPTNKANSIMNDALSLIEVVSGKNNSAADIRNLVSMAIRIGEIGKAYDAFLSVGGKHTPSFFQTKQNTNSRGDLNAQPEPQTRRDPV